ncbi:MAG: di-heme oxidoredictase family protein [Hyphomicrobiales bacterium]
MKLLTWCALLGVAAGIGCSALAEENALSTGKALFERQWADSVTGIGPLFNASSCNTCHREGGPARFTTIGGVLGARGLVVRLGRPNQSPDPYYGRQLQESAVAGLSPEARIFPRLELSGSNGLSHMAARIDVEGPRLHSETRTDIRIAPSLVGRAMLERIPVAAVLALADPDDRNRDGISGRARLIEGRLGRFGLKATATSIEDQIATAANVDMGLSSPDRDDPDGDCTPLETSCLQRASSHADEDISSGEIGALAAFVRSLAQPARPEPPQIFTKAGCTECHVPKFTSLDGVPLSPYTDLLLHDMGEGLAAGFGDEFASPREWRTAPLIDLASRAGKRRYLHDGRAANLAEAIRWHGGEAEKAKHSFEMLPNAEQSALIFFLSSL